MLLFSSKITPHFSLLLENPFIPLISDYGFKATFGNEGNSLFLRRALQALIQLDTPIAEVTSLPNELNRLNRDSRGGVYDLACIDESGRYFIVEMQLSEYPEFIQRMKFYSLYRFNTLVKKGDYTFEGLPRIYCIGILATVIFPAIAAYHNTAVLRNQAGELMDDQTVFITVELPKFDKSAGAVASDLDKLLYTMKTLHNAPADPIQWPEFWNEDWIKIAMQELDRRNMDPEELLQYELALATNAHIVRNARKQLEKAERDGREQGEKQGLAQGRKQAATATVEALLKMNVLTTEQIAAAAGVSAALVESIRRQSSR